MFPSNRCVNGRVLSRKRGKERKRPLKRSSSRYLRNVNVMVAILPSSFCVFSLTWLIMTYHRDEWFFILMKRNYVSIKIMSFNFAQVGISPTSNCSNTLDNSSIRCIDDCVNDYIFWILRIQGIAWNYHKSQ